MEDGGGQDADVFVGVFGPLLVALDGGLGLVPGALGGLDIGAAVFIALLPQGGGGLVGLGLDGLLLLDGRHALGIVGVGGGSGGGHGGHQGHAQHRHDQDFFHVELLSSGRLCSAVPPANARKGQASTAFLASRRAGERLSVSPRRRLLGALYTKPAPLGKSPSRRKTGRILRPVCENFLKSCFDLLLFFIRFVINSFRFVTNLLIVCHNFVTIAQKYRLIFYKSACKTPANPWGARVYQFVIFFPSA